MLAIGIEKAEADIRIRAVPHAEPVIRHVIGQEAGKRRIPIAAVENFQHVIDQIIHIDHHWQVRIARAIRIAAKNAEII